MNLVLAVWGGAETISMNELKLSKLAMENSSAFHVQNSSREILKIGHDGRFYVRGVAVPLDENEGRAVYEAFKAWLKETRAIQ